MSRKFCRDVLDRGAIKNFAQRKFVLILAPSHHVDTSIADTVFAQEDSF